MDGIFRKTADGQGGTIQGNRRQDHVDAASVRKACVGHGRGFIDPPVHGRSDPLDHIVEFFRCGKAFRTAAQDAVFLNKDVLRTVYHDLRYISVFHDDGQDIQFSDGGKNRFPKMDFPA